MSPRPLAVVACLFLAPPLSGHDLWIEPASFRAAAGSDLDLSVRVGERFAGAAVRLDPGKIVRLVRSGPDGTFDLEPAATGDPAARTGPLAAGAHVLAYEGGPFRHDMPADAFSKYLAEEGLDAVLAARRARGDERRPGRELYRRSVKALVVVGDAAGAPRDRALGLPLELLLESPPETGPGQARVRALFHGEPLPGLLLTATPRSEPQAARSARSDGEGRALLPLDRPGPWLIKGVHMAAAASGSAAEWESWWAALTFAIPAP